MGYTHYFSGKKDFTEQEWNNVSRDFKVLQEHLKHEAPIVSDDPNGIIINEERINFNDAHDDYETFYVPKKKEGFGFCKTARHNYDLMVCATLLLMHYHAPDALDISSDGDPRDWNDAMLVNAKLFGYAYKLPNNVYSSNESSATYYENQAHEKAKECMAANTTQAQSDASSNVQNSTSIKNRFSL